MNQKTRLVAFLVAGTLSVSCARCSELLTAKLPSIGPPKSSKAAWTPSSVASPIRLRSSRIRAARGSASGLSTTWFSKPNSFALSLVPASTMPSRSDSADTTRSAMHVAAHSSAMNANGTLPILLRSMGSRTSMTKRTTSLRESSCFTSSIGSACAPSGGSP